MPRAIPNWLLWAVILAATAASPFLAMLVLLFAAELLWDAASAAGAPASLTLCAVGFGALLLYKLRPRPAQPSAS